jgi:hypothetical protein
MKHEAPRIDDAAVALLAEQLEVDKRTIVRRLAGLPVRGRVGARIDRALAEHLTPPRPAA